MEIFGYDFVVSGCRSNIWFLLFCFFYLCLCLTFPRLIRLSIFLCKANNRFINHCYCIRSYTNTCIRNMSVWINENIFEFQETSVRSKDILISTIHWESRKKYETSIWNIYIKHSQKEKRCKTKIIGLHHKSYSQYILKWSD